MSREIRININFESRGLPLYVADLVVEHLHLITLCHEKGIIGNHGYQSYLDAVCAVQEKAQRHLE